MCVFIFSPERPIAARPSFNPVFRVRNVPTSARFDGTACSRECEPGQAATSQTRELTVGNSRFRQPASRDHASQPRPLRHLAPMPVKLATDSTPDHAQTWPGTSSLTRELPFRVCEPLIDRDTAQRPETGPRRLGPCRHTRPCGTPHAIARPFQPATAADCVMRIDQ